MTTNDELPVGYIILAVKHADGRNATYRIAIERLSSRSDSLSFDEMLHELTAVSQGRPDVLLFVGEGAGPDGWIEEANCLIPATAYLNASWDYYPRDVVDRMSEAMFNPERGQKPMPFEDLDLP